MKKRVSGVRSLGSRYPEIKLKENEGIWDSNRVFKKKNLNKKGPRSKNKKDEGLVAKGDLS